ncbi:porin family protein [Hymenobacter properus]|uniref:PorT family protein n=1 Tax=Hymenobacter properus TaxID=2791026 RepID=A0A931BF45_9BACT|nr:porin family protein [Hymenobacter properus]MBF9141137.1 PorT family protein [Hymenobacter properus]MBR7719946.1 PorT family protein [Microvirga sp. SRT04]
MNRRLLFLPAALTGALNLAGGRAQAQLRVSVGPTLGLNVTTAPYFERRSFATTHTQGVEAGIQAYIGQNHWELQPALLFSQKGFGINDNYTEESAGQTTIIVTKSTYRLNYLTLPLNLAYNQRADGQGFCLFAGSYAGVLLGGTYSNGISYSVRTPRSASGGYSEFSGPVAGGDYFSNTFGDKAYYCRRFDFGVQGGLGYRHGPLLVQAGYSLGLRNLGADFQLGNGSTVDGPTFRNRAFQASFAYLFSFTK